MTVKMIGFLYVVLSVAVFATTLNGQSMFWPGDCPEGRYKGDVWELKPGCMRCYCNQTGYGCRGCALPLAPPPVGSGCTIVYNNTALHPLCCPRYDCTTVG